MSREILLWALAAVVAFHAGAFVSISTRTKEPKAVDTVNVTEQPVQLNCHRERYPTPRIICEENTK